MQAEEAVLQFVVGWELRLYEGVDPGGSVVLVAVTVGLIVHNLAGMDALVVVNLPEDDSTVLGTAETIAGGGVMQLDFTQIARRYGRMAELRINGKRPSYEV